MRFDSSSFRCIAVCSRRAVRRGKIALPMAMRRVPLFVVLLSGGATMARADTSVSAVASGSPWPTCRTSPIREDAWKQDPEEGGEKLHVTRDVDGDGVPDRLDAWDSSGSGGGMNAIKLTLSRTGRVLEVDESYSFESLTGVIVVPDEVIADERIRRFIEDALSRTICDGPDPSLAWLRDPSHALRFVPGPPRLPTSYLVFSTRPADLARAADAEFGSDDAKAVWVSYLGSNHGRGNNLRMDQPPRVLARSTGRVLLGTAHGVILTGDKRSRHAWLYVNEEPGHKLRFPSIRRARFAGDVAVIETSGGTVRVRLSTGAIVGKAEAAEREVQ